MCFVIVLKQLRLFAVNINDYHWLVHQPITIDFQYVRRPPPASRTPHPQLYGLSHYRDERQYTNCPITVNNIHQRRRDTL